LGSVGGGGKREKRIFCAMTGGRTRVERMSTLQRKKKEGKGGRSARRGATSGGERRTSEDGVRGAKSGKGKKRNEARRWPCRLGRGRKIRKVPLACAKIVARKKKKRGGERGKEADEAGRV